MNNMFCFQCEQTAGGKACTGSRGVCGKQADTSNLMGDMTGSLVALAKAVKGKARKTSTDFIVLEGLFSGITNVNFNNETLAVLKARITAEQALYGSHEAPYTMNDLWRDQEDVRSLKSLILLGLRGMAAYAYHAWVLGFKNDTVNDFFFEALAAIGSTLGTDSLLPMVLKTGQVNLTCMEMLDKANTSTYGDPVPVEVPLLGVEGRLAPVGRPVPVAVEARRRPPVLQDDEEVLHVAGRLQRQLAETVALEVDG